jgi:hypothetical protein
MSRAVASSSSSSQIERMMEPIGHMNATHKIETAAALTARS